MQKLGSLKLRRAPTQILQHLVFILAATSFVGTAGAQEAVIDFEGLVGTTFVRRDAPYVEGGFSFTTEYEETGVNLGQGKFNSVHEGNHFFTGSVSFYKEFTLDRIILTKEGGGT